jgi:putative phosphoesterase
MKIVIISDVHANLEALACLPADYDYLLCAGDLVDYGPEPKACLDWVRRRAKVVVRGNHDQAAGYRVDCGCSYAMKELSLLTRQLGWQALDADDINYLKQLPLSQESELGGCQFYLTHAVPGDLYRYLEAEVGDEELREMLRCTSAQVIIWGHTHKPWIRRLDNRWVINPGSLGQPRDGNPQASFCVWEDGEVNIIRRDYDRQATIRKLNHSPLAPRHREQLINILQTGSSPTGRQPRS